MTCCAHAATNRWPCYWGKKCWSLGLRSSFWVAGEIVSTRWYVCLSMNWTVSSFGGMICLADKTYVSHVASYLTRRHFEESWKPLTFQWPFAKPAELQIRNFYIPGYPVFSGRKTFFWRFDLLHIKASCVKHHPFPIWHSLNPWEDQAQSRQGKLMGTGFHRWLVVCVECQFC